VAKTQREGRSAGLATDLAARGAMPAEEVKNFIDHSPLLFRYETGRMTKQDFFREVCAATGFRGDLEEFSRLFADIFTPIDPMVELHARLRRHAVPTFIFSNTNELAVAHIRTQFPFFSQFNDYILSYEHGAMKPHPKLYEVVERVTGCVGARILYLDDRWENAEAGLKRGWQVIHHSTPEKSIAQIEGVHLLDGA
jgi:HAD superfamily hydrolase (TIGR01509 family)